MNIENFEKLYNHLCVLRMNDQEKKFNMRYWLYDLDEHWRTDTYEHCKTAGCLAGWAFAISNDFKSGLKFDQLKAQKWLGLSDHAADYVFHGIWSYNGVDGITLNECIGYLSACLEYKSVFATQHGRYSEAYKMGR